MLGVDFDLHVKGTTPPLLWSRNAYKLSIVGVQCGIIIFLVVIMYVVPGAVCFRTAAPVQFSIISSYSLREWSQIQLPQFSAT